MREKTKLILYAALMAVVAFSASAALSGCATTPDGVSRPIFTAAEIEIILEETQIAVKQYLAVVVPDPTPAQQLAMTAGRIAVRLALSKLREAGMFEAAVDLEVKAGLISLAPVPEIEPLE